MSESEATGETHSGVHPLEQQRRVNRDAIAALGIDPYGARADGLIPLAEARAMYDETADAAHQASENARRQASKDRVADDELPALIDNRPRVRVAGRVMLKRGQGKLIWAQLRDHTTGPSSLLDGVEADPAAGVEARPASAFAGAMAPDLQLAVSAKDVASPGFELIKQVDLGDVLIAEGALMKTRMGEVTVWVERLEIASKSIAPPPEKWSGLQDVEARYRRRYVDLYAHPAALQVMRCRSKIVSAMRRVLESQDFMEVDTPVLQTLAGGAAARPFVTHMNALDMRLYMRIAPELFLKRCMVGGLPRVYEFSRNFRNEGLSPRHNPEFTSLEVYQAFGDYGTMAELTEQMLRAAAGAVASFMGKAEGDLTLPWNGGVIDWGAAFRRVTFSELFEAALGFPFSDADACLASARERGLKTTGTNGVELDPILIANELFEEVAEPTIDPYTPTFVLDYPASLSPLTRPRRDNPVLAERWDLFIGGMEVGPAYTELNDPDIQAEKFAEQLAGVDDEESTFRTYDADFVNALKVGMPPAGGLGLGIDRLVMLMTDQRSIRDVILFPFMRPEPGA